jgi:outer membrane protein assembly factor BamD
MATRAAVPAFRARASMLGRVLSCLLAAGLLVGCASSNDAAKVLNPDPPDKMYARADALLNGGNYSEAARKFEDLDRDHPYSPEARRAIVMAAYAYYKAGKYPEAVASARRYTTLHPGTKDAALAHHIIASANFDEIRDPTRDQTATRKALAELKTLVQRYPDSPYGKQAVNRIRLAEDALAASEMSVGRYYQQRNNQVGAINRYKVVVTEYQTTAHVEEALYRLAETNMVLGIVPEAQTAAAVLGHNYPNSEWYGRAFALLKSGGVSPQINQGTWLSNAIKAVTPGGQQQQKKPEPAAAPAEPPPGLPKAEDLPTPRVPSDVPVSSAPSKPPMGLAQRNQ